VTVWGALAGGAVGTVILTSGLRLAQEIGVTRMDIPLLLGTMLTSDRRKASVIGYFMAFGIGLVFSLVYAGVFEAVGNASWWFGLALGAVHAAFVGSGLVTTLLPAVHPRMGNPWSDADETPILEPPGFMLFNYGRRTALVSVVLHLAFGAIVGAFAAGF
jgi:hypothetical protein